MGMLQLIIIAYIVTRVNSQCAVALEYNGNAHTIDLNTGQVTTIITSSIFFNSLALNRKTNKLYAYALSGGVGLAQINHCEGTVTPLSSQGSQVRGMAVNAHNGHLFATHSDGNFYNVNTTTGVLNELGSPGYTQSLFFSNDYKTLYGMDVNGRLYRYDSYDSNPTLALITTMSISGIQSVDWFDRETNVEAIGCKSAHNILYKMNFETGAITALATLSQTIDCRGMEIFHDMTCSKVVSSCANIGCGIMNDFSGGIYTIDLDTMQANQIWTSSIYKLNSLSVNREKGTLIAHSYAGTSKGIIEVDLCNGYENIHGNAFNAYASAYNRNDRNLYAVAQVIINDNQLYRLNTTESVGSPISSGSLSTFYQWLLFDPITNSELYAIKNYNKFISLTNFDSTVSEDTLYTYGSSLNYGGADWFFPYSTSTLLACPFGSGELKRVTVATGEETFYGTILGATECRGFQMFYGYRCDALPCTPTLAPTQNPTNLPSKIPTNNPSVSPTNNPVSPTNNPSVSPTNNPVSPTNNPSVSPANNPAPLPTMNPSSSPTNNPSSLPSISPTNNPSVSPANNPAPLPTKNPSVSPTYYPSLLPTINPSVSPTNNPALLPTYYPSSYPSKSPTANPVSGTLPSISPSESPSYYPTDSPTEIVETRAPTTMPSRSPLETGQTRSPSITPTISPSTEGPTVNLLPTETPSRMPTENLLTGTSNCIQMSMGIMFICFVVMFAFCV